MKKYSESGRSLIEIIAILVIMALLMLAALFGFQALLAYLQYKQTSDEVSVVATRYKLKKLQARKSGSRVRIRDFYPEGNECNSSLNIPKSECVATPDGGHLELISDSDVSSFAVIVSGVKCVSCREIVAMGAYGMIVPQEITKLGDDVELIGYTPKEAKEKVEQICLNQGGEACTGEDTIRTFSLIHGNECDGGAKYIVGGQCSFCRAGKVKAPKGRETPDMDGCCDKTHVECGFCGGCESGKNYCKGDICVECLSDAECVGKYGQEKPYCDADGFCKPCNQPNQECKDASGSGIGMWCDADLNCTKKCDACYKPDDNVPGRCVPNFEIGQAPGKSCNGTPGCPGQCKTPMDCDGGVCICPSNTPENSPCNYSICPDSCGKAADGTQLVCRNGKCVKPADCSGLPAKRLFGDRCIPTDCPCDSAALACEGSGADKICLCGPKGVTKGAPCWGTCGCGASLKCSVEGDDEGECQCADLKKGDPCVGNDAAKDCLCTDKQEGGKYLMICDTSYRCTCNPEIPEYSLPAGSTCLEECNQCKKGLKCQNNKCGCLSDDDCEGTEYCDLTVNECKCRNPLKRDPVTEKCVCPVEGDYWTRFTVPTNPTYVCCPEGEAPRMVDGKYECLRICEPGEYISVAMMLDYSNSSKYNGFKDYRNEIANGVINLVRQVNSDTKIGVFREKNNHKTEIDDNGQNCENGKNATTIQNFETKAPDLNQALCAYNCGDGTTCFPEAIGQINAECSKNRNGSIFFLMTDGVIPSNTVSATGCCRNPNDKNCFVWEAYYDKDPLDVSNVHNDQQYLFTTKVPVSTIKSALIKKMCIPAPDPKDRQPIE